MNCPACERDWLAVEDTINHPDGRIFRRRRCISCKTVFRTVEIMDDGSAEFNSDFIFAYNLKNTNTVRKRGKKCQDPSSPR